MYQTLNSLLALINDPARSICQHIISDNRRLFEKARGSTHNHQTWDGGYIDHVTDGMNFTVKLYRLLLGIGRPLAFSLSDALLIFFLHDLEKPWRIMLTETGEAINRPGLSTKAEFKAFREEQLKQYKLILTEAQHNALTYVEGEMQDYSSKRRVMSLPLSVTWWTRGQPVDGTTIQNPPEKMSG